MARQRAFGSILVAASVLALIMPANVAATRAPEAMPAAATADAGASQPPGGKPIKDSWIVTVDRRTDPSSSAKAIAKAAGGTSGATYTHALHGFVFHGSAKAAQNLKKNPHVRTVVANRHVAVTAETLTPGVQRILADHPTKPDAHDSGFTGAGVRVAILDTGIDLTHPDLVANIDAGLGKNCVNPSLPPQDGHGHGTHVSGIVAAVAGNGIGVVGVAPSARLVPFKVLDDTGNGEWSMVICALDVLTGYLTDGDPSNDVSVANMSLGDTGSIGTCTDGGLRQAFCTATAAGLVITAASGNSFTDASTFIPAAFPEVITVSAMTDLDGNPGGLGGCKFIVALLSSYCDDTIANFSNVGSVIDVTAPGVDVYSSWTGGGYMSESGTSMAAPYVAGVAALVRAANPSLTAPAVEALIKSTGDNPDGTSTRGGCASATQWSGDRDGIAEPIVNAYRAAQVAADPDFDPPPTVAITNPAAGVVNGTVPVTATAGDPDGIASVQAFVDGLSVGSDTAAPYSIPWDTTTTFDGAHQIMVRATDTTGSTACATVDVTTGLGVKGDWVGVYGADGYDLGAWNGSTDLAVLPTGVTATIEQGLRYTWANAGDIRALENPAQTERRATGWYHATEVRIRLNFTSAYSGTLHLYAVDWASTARRQTVIVDDGSGPKTINLSTAFDGGAWMHFPITVAAGGSVVIKVDRTAGTNGVLGGLFLGGAGTPPPPPPPPPTPTLDQPGVKGDWVGVYGADGYDLGAWNGSTDLAVLPTGVTATIEQGLRYTWANAGDIRALENPAQTERRATGWYHATEVRIRLNFTSAYSGTLHLYAVDWASTARRQTVIVDDGSGPKTINLSTAFDGGAWMHFPITVAAGGSVVIKVDRTAGTNGVLGGLFLGGAGTPPPPPPPPPTPTLDQPGVKGDWVGVYGADGYDLGAWNGSTDLAVLPTGVTATIEQGLRYTWANAGDIRALENPAQTERRATGWYHATEVRIRLNFTSAYSGTLHLYAVDWASTARRQTVIVDDGSGPKTINLSTAFDGGAWMHFPITVAAGGSVVIKVDRTAGTNGVLGGLFLGGAGTPPPPPPPPPTPTLDQPGVKGDWVGVYGADGYDLGAWNGSTDLAVLPTGVTATIEQGLRYTWANAGDIRALENPAQTERRATGWYHATEVRIRLNFTSAYSGTLHLYAVDWASTARRQTVIVDDGSGPKTINLSTAFDGGAWMHFPITVAAGGSVVIKVDRTAGTNGVLGGLFLGGAGTPP